MKKKVLFTAAFMLATVGAYAQGNGIAGITEATEVHWERYFSITTIPLLSRLYRYGILLQ